MHSSDELVRDTRANANSKRIRNDVILILLLLIIALSVFLLSVLFAEKGAYVTVMVNGEEYGRYSLSEDREIRIVNPHNESYVNVLVIENGEAYVSEAHCPRQICVQHRPVSYSWQSITCRSHKLTIVVSGSESGSDVDVSV